MRECQFFLKHPDSISDYNKSRNPVYVIDMGEVAKKYQNKVFNFIHCPHENVWKAIELKSCNGSKWSWLEDWLIPIGKNGQLHLDFGK